MEAISDFPARAMPLRPASGVCSGPWPQPALAEAQLGVQSRPEGRLSGECRIRQATLCGGERTMTDQELDNVWFTEDFVLPDRAHELAAPQLGRSRT